ncbi:MAG: polymerase, sigma-24 subunit, subfamily [Verrucomicrobiales bacterium]|nr:polymerase, sigma-24 subunit, subfamily [Verrucomicrobiales bacterium]
MSSGVEAKLITRCRAGEPTAWDELFDLHYAATGRFVFQLSPQLSQEDADEICQDVFLSVIKNLQTFQGNSQLQTWIFRIASNKARDYMEKQRAAKRGGGVVPVSLQAENPETGLTPDPPSSAPTPDVVLLKAENAEMVGHALEKLEAPCREVIELRYFGDLSYEEISRELSLNEKTVSSRLSKCLDRLEKIAREMFCGKDSTPFPV